MKEDFGGNDIANLTSFHLTTCLLHTLLRDFSICNGCVFKCYVKVYAEYGADIM